MPVTQSKPFTKHATTAGSYYTSNVGKAQLRELLRGVDPTRFKTAAIGGEQEQGFEQAFSSLAYAYMKDKSPRLIDFIVGFQLVDRNEDNTKAIGIFGFKVGDQWLYAPIFFLNGDLKGHELLYVKNQDAFVPMKENWVNYLISRRPHVLGKGSDQNARQLGGLSPNLRRLTGVPGMAKFSRDQPAPAHIDEWALDALPAFFALGMRKAASLYENTKGDLNFDAVVKRPFQAALAPTASTFDLGTFLQPFPLLKNAYENCYRRYPLLKAGFDQFYGADFFLRMAEQAKQNAGLLKRAESYILPPEGFSFKKEDAKNKQPNIFDKPDKKNKTVKNAGLYIYAADLDVDENVSGGITINKPELTDDERAKLLRDTVLIKDERGTHSIAYNTQTRTDLINPSETGIYEILEKPGSFDEMVIISNPHSGRGREDFCLVLRKSSPRNWKNTYRGNLWAKQCDCPDPAVWKKYVESLGDTTKLEKGGTYVAVNANGSGTCPFEVRQDYGDGVYRVRWFDTCDYTEQRLSKRDRPHDWEVGYSAWDAKIYINHRKGSGLKSVNGELSIPDSYKIIKLMDPPKPNKDDRLVPISACCDGESDPGSTTEPIQPGNLIDIQLFVTKNASVVRVHDTGTAVTIKGPLGTQQLNKKAALLSLVRDHGLREEQARVMLKQAAIQQVHNRAAMFLVKYANQYLQPGPSAPAFPAPETGSEQIGYGSVSSIYPQEENIPIDGMSSQLTDPSVYDPFYMPDQQAMQVAQQAAQTGQKEVFDTAMIGGMLKAVRQDSLVDRYLGDFMKALDKLGRILFMFYWHQEEFEDRYGKQDLPELEDALRNAFEVLGDVVLFLKEKQVGGGPGALNVSGLGSADSGEPNLQEAARN